MPEIETNSYWIARECERPSDDYWRDHLDPDGILRDRMSEREQYLDDRKEERKWIADLKPGWVLDVGCGPGWWLNDIDPQWSKVGIDTSRLAVDAARELGLTVMHGDFSTAELPEFSFDLVIHYHVIEHVSAPLFEMACICAALKPGGRLLIGTPDFASPCALRFRDNYRMLHDETHRNLFTRESMSRMLHDFGFRIEHLAYPFPDRYATAENFLRWNDTTKVSPAWPGNWMTFYCERR